MSPKGAKSVSSTDTLTCRLVGPAARCRWPWTLTSPAGTFSSGMWVSTSGGSVAHYAVRQVLWKPARRSPAISRS